MKKPLLEVRHLETAFYTEEGTVKAVDDVSFTIHEEETVCIVGESEFAREKHGVIVHYAAYSRDGENRTGSGAFFRKKPVGAETKRNAENPRLRNRYDFSGADDLFESGVYDR